MSAENPYRCFYHDWNGIGRCPYCRKERENAKTIKIVGKIMPDIEDTIAMSKGDLVKRLWEARMMHRYGRRYLASFPQTDDQFAAVMVGNPKQEIIIAVEDV